MHLLTSLIVARSHTLDGLHHQVATASHQLIVHRTHGIIVRDRLSLLTDDSTFIYLVVKQERCNTRLPLTIYHRPIDGCCATILGQQRGVQVEGSQPRHSPNNLGQHTERNDDTQVGLKSAHSLHKSLIAQALGLQNGKTQLASRHLHIALVQLLTTPCGLIGRSDHRHDVIPLLHQATQRSHGTLGSTHKYYS